MNRKEVEKLLTSVEDNTMKKSIVDVIRIHSIPDISSHTLLKINRVL